MDNGHRRPGLGRSQPRREPGRHGADAPVMARREDALGPALQQRPDRRARRPLPRAAPGTSLHRARSALHLQRLSEPDLRAASGPAAGAAGRMDGQVLHGRVDPRRVARAQPPAERNPGSPARRLHTDGAPPGHALPLSAARRLPLPGGRGPSSRDRSAVLSAARTSPAGERPTGLPAAEPDPVTGGLVAGSNAEGPGPARATRSRAHLPHLVRSIHLTET
jgi:hypothetical protein